MTLRVADRLLDKPDDYIKAMLRHEAIHIGYPRHDANFREIATLVKAPLTEEAAESDGKVTIEVKDGTRFKPYKQFDSEAEARTWVKDAMKNELKGKRVRMTL